MSLSRLSNVDGVLRPTAGGRRTAGCANSASSTLPVGLQLHSQFLGQPLLTTLPSLPARVAKHAKRHVQRTVSVLASPPPRILAPAQYTYKYCSIIEGGGLIYAHVDQGEGQYRVKVETTDVPLGEDESLWLQWGTYRSSASKWFQPNDMVPWGSENDPETGLLRSPLATDWSSGRRSISFNVPSSLTPLTLAATLVAVSYGKPSRCLRLHGDRLLTVPIGMGAGHVEPLGPSLLCTAPDGSATVNFAVASRGARGMNLCLVRVPPTGSRKAAGMMEVMLDPHVNKTGNVWHVCVEGLRDLPTLAYGWRAGGDVAWQQGDRFTPGLVMLDPYAPVLTHVMLPDGAHVTPLQSSLARPERAGDPADVVLGSLACLAGGDWQVDDPGHPGRALESAVVLEVDVRTFTAGDTNVAPHHRGKFVGVLDKLEYVRAIGANTLLLTPCVASMDGMGLMGRAPLSFFAPDPTLATGDGPTAAAEELRGMVAGLHRAGIEVWLALEFCFTAEGSDDAPNPVSLRGLDAGTYYRPGGLLNVGHAAVRRLVADSLAHWATEYGVDGFCIVNAETLCISRDGVVQDAPALAEALALHPLLRSTKLLAWSGNDGLLPRSGERGFPHWGQWLERNLRFSRDLASYLVHDARGLASAVATRMTGSADLFAARWDGGLPGNLAAGRRPALGINGMTVIGRSSMSDLLGDQAANKSLVKAAVLAPLMAQGLPLVGQDTVADPEVGRFVGVAARLRGRYLDLLQPPAFDSPRDIRWHGAAAGSEPDWAGAAGSSGSNVMGFSVRSTDGRGIFVAFNPHHEHVTVSLPDPPLGSMWGQVIDTGKVPPYDALLAGPEPVTSDSVVMAPKSAIALEAMSRNSPVMGAATA